MYITSDFEYMKKELKFSLSTIDYIQKRYGDELTDSQKSRIMYLLNTLQELNLDVKYLNQNPEIISCIDIYSDEEFLRLIEYIKKNAKKKSKNTVLAFFLSANEIIKNNREKEVDNIIKLLEKEGLTDLLDNKKISEKILKHGKYDIISKNIKSLSEVKTYRNIIRKNPEILLSNATNEIQKIINEIKKDEEENKDLENINENENIANNIADEDYIDDKDNGNEEQETDYDNKVENEKILLGSEDKVQQTLLALKKYNIPYTILIINPEICRRKNISEVERILEILKNNDIPFNILNFCPEILSDGKSKIILETITCMKSQNINLNILCVCPSILIKSSVTKIQNVLDTMEKEGINRNIIYSCPEVLISGKVKILLEIKNEIVQNYPDINIVLDMAPYVFVEKISSMSSYINGADNDTNIDRTYLSSSNNILVIRNIDEAQKIINVLKKEDINLDVVKNNNKTLTKTTAKQTKDILETAEILKIDKSTIEENSDILIYANSVSMKDLNAKLQEYRPLKYREILKENPDMYIKTDAQKIEEVFRIFERQDINYTFVDRNPKVLIREDIEEIEKVSKKLKNNNYTIEEIEKTPKILIDGKEKYFDRNKKILQKNKIDIPLSYVHVMKTRTLEKNIDILIENKLHKYINSSPKILEMENIDLAKHIVLAKLYNIKLEKKDENGNKSLDEEYFKTTDKELVEKFNMDKFVIEKVTNKVEKKRDRQVKNQKLYSEIYPIIEKQADITLEQYINDEVSFRKNEKIVSKQKLIRETYIDLEENYAKKGRKAIKEFDANEKVEKKLDKLTKNSNGGFENTKNKEKSNKGLEKGE